MVIVGYGLLEKAIIRSPPPPKDKGEPLNKSVSQYGLHKCRLYYLLNLWQIMKVISVFKRYRKVTWWIQRSPRKALSRATSLSFQTANFSKVWLMERWEMNATFDLWIFEVLKNTVNKPPSSCVFVFWTDMTCGLAYVSELQLSVALCSVSCCYNTIPKSG